jgi:hypothetical protein
VSTSLIGLTTTRAAVGGVDNEDLPTGNMRQVPLNIKIVFIGIKQQYINVTDGYFNWTLPPFHIQRETQYGTNWGVNYTFDYNYSFNQTYDNAFFAYLNMIKKDDNVEVNPFTGLNFNRFYNANAVEDWLYSNPSGYGGIPSGGYVLFLVNVTRLPGDPYPSPAFRPHYYNLTYADIDSTATVTDNWYGRWMTSWGGHHRLYFIDVSAGASSAAVNAWNPAQVWWNHYYIPIWSLNMNLKTKNGVNLLNNYLGSFVFGAAYDLFSSDFLYPPRIAPNFHYNITVVIFDNCTSYYAYPIENQTGGYLPPYGFDFGVTQSTILKAFTELVPYAAWTINLTYVHLNGTGDPEPYRTLWSVIRNSERTQDSFGNPVAYVDRDLLYNYLQGHLAQFVRATQGQLLIPVFVFAFKDGFNLGYQYEGYEYDNYWGFGYPDVVLVSHSVTDLLGGGGRTPYGFTQTIIHEVGHAVGLAHPFWWDYDEDFVASVMAYYPYEYAFSQFDKDAIQRGHADYYIISALSMMENATVLKTTRQMTAALLKLYNQATGNLTTANTDYANMDYYPAMTNGSTALSLFAHFILGASGQPLLTTSAAPPDIMVPVIASVVVGIVVGVAIGLFMSRKRKK